MVYAINCVNVLINVSYTRILMSNDYKQQLRKFFGCKKKCYTASQLVQNRCGNFYYFQVSSITLFPNKAVAYNLISSVLHDIVFYFSHSKLTLLYHNFATIFMFCVEQCLFLQLDDFPQTERELLEIVLISSVGIGKKSKN